MVSMSAPKRMVSEQRMETFWAIARTRMDPNCREIVWATGPAALARRSRIPRPNNPALATRTR